MRVIAGTAKGRILLGPKGAEIRPVLDKVKGAIFNIIGNIEGCRVLDLFAGTGSVGIETLSRGASQVTFVDDSPAAIVLIRKNLERCGFIGQARLIELPIPFPRRQGGGAPREPVVGLAQTPLGRDLRSRAALLHKAHEGQRSESFPRCSPPLPPWDLIFVDPPYDQGLVNRTLRWIVREKMVADGGTVVVEHSPREPIAEDVGLKVSDQRKYGQTLISFLRLPAEGTRGE